MTPTHALLTPGHTDVPPAMLRVYRQRRSPAVVEDGLPLPPRKVLLNHACVSVSTALLLVHLLDEAEIRDCDHCGDFHYALIAFVRGLAPLAKRHAADVLYDIEVNGGSERHVRAGVPG